MDKKKKTEIFTRIEKRLEQERKIIDKEYPKCEALYPFVRFEIQGPQDFEEYYREFLIGLVAEFLETIDPEKEQKRVVCYFLNGQSQMWNGDEGGIGDVEVEGLYISHCKMDLYDGQRSGKYGFNLNLWKGVVFRDHDDARKDRVKIYLLANAFEKFLKEKGVKFERFNTKREKSDE